MRILMVIITVLAFSFDADAFNKEKKRGKIQAKSAQILERLYSEKPHLRKVVANAAGYATFSNVGVNVILLSGGGGKGMVRSNSTGEITYMKMASAGVGIGLGIKDFEAVFVFHRGSALQKFVDKGWDFSGQADAAAKSGDKGGSAETAGTVVGGVDVYQMTKSGLALQATLQGTKYWKNKKLNRK